MIIELNDRLDSILVCYIWDQTQVHAFTNEARCHYIKRPFTMDDFFWMWNNP